MKKITFGDAAKMTSPNPITLVCTGTPDGRTNLAAVSWWTYLSTDPLMVCFAMGKKSYSGELVRQNKEVLLAMPAAEIAEAAFRCGTVSGRSENKADKFGIELTEFAGSSIKVPVHSRMVFACRLANTVETGNHYLYICDVDGMYGDNAKTQLFAWEGYASLRPL